MKVGDTIKTLSYLAISFAIFLVIFTPKPSLAFSADLLISELYPNPETGNEWIELYNPTEMQIDLTNYAIEDGTHHPKFLTGYTIEAKSYLTIYKSIDFTFGLNNDSDQLILKKDTLEIDGLSWGTPPDIFAFSNYPAPSKGFSLSRKIPSSEDPFFLTAPTENLPYFEIVYPKNLIINEISPAPAEGADFEFIEIKNLESFEINLKNYILDDIENGGSSPYQISKDYIVPPGEYAVIEKSDSGLDRKSVV